MFDNLKKKISEAVNKIVKREDAKKEEGQEIAGAKETAIINGPERKQEEIDGDIPQSSSKEEPISDSYAPIAKPAAPIKDAYREEKAQEQKKEEKAQPRLSLKTKIKGAILGRSRLGRGEIEDFAESIRSSLLESEVSYDTADEITSDIRKRLAEGDIDTRKVREELNSTVRESLREVLEKGRKGVDLGLFVSDRIASGKTPVKILFLGPNGTGKTTTMAKIAHMLKSKKISCVLSASDTFRAAAIEQTVYHGERVGVPVIKSGYGADPASIAFDAIAYAKSHNIDVVLVDSAGRQETNRNLIGEVQKIARVVKPDLTIFVGESISGNVLPNQIKEFSKFVAIDGIILTKLDCDSKGGNAISITNTTGIPILFFGIGEGYDALAPYSIDFVISSIAPN